MTDLTTFHHVLRFVHIVLGSIGLIAFWVPVFAPKGRPLHVFFGRVFAACAYAVAATALFSCGWALVDPRSFVGAPAALSAEEAGEVEAGVRFLMGILGVLAIWLAAGLEMGLRAVRTRAHPERFAGPRLYAVCGASALASAALAGFGGWQLWLGSGEGRYWLPLALGLFGVADAVKARRFLKNPRPTPMAWWYAHMENMLGCGIAFHTAFLVFGASRLLGLQFGGPWALLPWLLPTAIGVPATAIWVRYYRRKFGEA